jgi:hypothetical protein
LERAAVRNPGFRIDRYGSDVAYYYRNRGGLPCRRVCFLDEGEILERGLKRALAEREEVLRELATAARLVDRSASKEEAGFARAHQTLLSALEKAGRFI